MPELADLLKACTDAQERLRAAEAHVDEERAKLSEAVRAASSAGVSNTLLGKVLGLSRQRIAQLLNRDS